MGDNNTMILNMGPQHPSTHGVLRVVLELDGEVVVKATPDIGFLHRGLEKLAEHKTYHQCIPLTDRLDYVAGMSNNLAYVLAVEKLLGLEAPPRAQAIRVLLSELQRISSHLLWLGTHAHDIGAMTPLFYAMRERDEILFLFERVCGSRLTPSYFRVGGASITVTASKHCTWRARWRTPAGSRSRSARMRPSSKHCACASMTCSL